MSGGAMREDLAQLSVAREAEQGQKVATSRRCNRLGHTRKKSHAQV